EYRTLEELAGFFERIDPAIVHFLGRRAEIVRQVGRIKRKEHKEVRRPDIEEKRLQAITRYAEDLGVDPGQARRIFREIIEVSCEIQEGMLGESPEPDFVDEEDVHKELRQNLLRLTELVAPIYEEKYGGIATKVYREFEQRMIDRVSRDLSHREVALDLGCATGPLTRHLAPYFKRVVGLDLSPAMIAEAQKRNTSSRVEFLVHDVEEGLPLENESLSFVLMNMGTASDIVEFPRVLGEIKRVLKQGGVVFLSFYNEEALFYTLGIPYYPGLSAEFNELRNTLDVRFGQEIFRVFAQPYTIVEIRILMRSIGLQIRKNWVWSYPTIASLLPEIPFDEKGVRRVREADEALADKCISGAYIIVAAEKT
ncbi:MAG: methyltransferase domain-containing protein, partial [Patescibacteria group bacterium]